MAARKEDAIVAEIKEYLQSRGGVCFKIHGGVFQSAGIPDLYYVENGRHIWLEVKRDTDKYGVTPLQQATINKLIRQRAEVYVVTSLEQVKQLFR